MSQEAMRSAARLLQDAREQIMQGHASQALGCVLNAVREQGGQEAVLRLVSQCREIMRARGRNEAQAQGEQEEEKKIEEEYKPDEDEKQAEPEQELGQDSKPLEVETSHHQRQRSLLEEQGRQQILLDAFNDGSSVLCPHCHGLIKADRFEIHVSHWCDALETENEAIMVAH